MSKKSINDIRVPTYDDLFTNEEQRQEAKLEKIMEIPVEDIQEFKNHPFRVRNDEQMSELVKSVSANGILVPVLVRPHPNSHGYEMISGHRRMNAAMVNGQEKIQVIVRELTDDQATIIMVDSNIQRENILPTERGFAYKMKLDAMIRQSGRPKDNGSQVGNHLKGKKSIEVLAKEERKSKNSAISRKGRKGKFLQVSLQKKCKVGVRRDIKISGKPYKQGVSGQIKFYLITK